MKQILMNTRILNDIKKLSSEDQTSCLEGFHSTLNQFHPKMICFSWLGAYCRHILASLHFNENLLRKPQKNKGWKRVPVSDIPKVQGWWGSCARNQSTADIQMWMDWQNWCSACPRLREVLSFQSTRLKLQHLWTRSSQRGEVEQRQFKTTTRENKTKHLYTLQLKFKMNFRSHAVMPTSNLPGRSERLQCVESATNLWKTTPEIVVLVPVPPKSVMLVCGCTW